MQTRERDCYVYTFCFHFEKKKKGLIQMQTSNRLTELDNSVDEVEKKIW